MISEDTNSFVKQLFRESSKRIALLETMNKSIVRVNRNENIANGVWTESLKFLVREISFVLEISRVSIWRYERSPVYLECEMLYTLNTKEFTSGSIIKRESAPRYFEAIEEEKIITANDVASDTIVNEFKNNYFAHFNIKSLLDVPIYYRGKVWGVICCEQVGERRDWSIDESNYIKNLTEFINITLTNIERNNAYEIIAEHQLEIERQKKRLEYKKIEVEEMHSKMLDSVQYAQSIQKALLPPTKMFDAYLSDYFIYYKPKDIVSGDFYWFKKIDNRIFIAAIDCTGHGVPGALMSVIANYTLNRAINEFNLKHPADILGTVSDIIKTELNRHEEYHIHDGMDLGMLCIDLEEEVIEFAGAYNPLVMISRNRSVKIKGDRIPIGYNSSYVEKEYQNHTFPLKKGVRYYLFTDGYPDQFGGERGKKFTNRRLEEALLEIHKLPFSEQEIELEKRYQDWKGLEEQIDDILVLGFKI